MKMFIFRGTGFIGRCLEWKLRGRGHNLLVLSHENGSKTGNQFIRGDVPDTKKL